MANYFKHIRTILCLCLAIFIQIDVIYCSGNTKRTNITYDEIRNVLSMWNHDGFVVPSGSYCDLLNVFCIESGNLAIKEKAEPKSVPIGSFEAPLIFSYLEPSAQTPVFEDLRALEKTEDQLNLLSILFISVLYEEIVRIEAKVYRGVLLIQVIGKNDTKLHSQAWLINKSYSSLLNLILFIETINESKNYKKCMRNLETLLTPECTIATFVYYFLPDERSYSSFLTSTYKSCCKLQLPVERLFARHRSIANRFQAILSNMADLIRITPGITRVVPFIVTTKFVSSSYSYTGLKAISCIFNTIGNPYLTYALKNAERHRRIKNIFERGEPFTLRMVYEQLVYFLKGNIDTKMSFQEMHTWIANTVGHDNYKWANFIGNKKVRLWINSRVAIQIFEENMTISADVLGECPALNRLNACPEEYEELKRKLRKQRRKLEYLIMRLVTEYTYIPTGAETINN